MEFYDPLYGRIHVLAPYDKIVNSRPFRRLQHLRQLGLCYLSFPGGNHTRFEHSLGAFYLAGRIASSISKSSIGKREDRERLGNLICAAALCHDIGHGPLSHASENTFLALGGKVSHEELGAAILQFGLEEESSVFEELGLSSKIVGDIIKKTATNDPLVYCAAEFVSSDLDVDRLDYLHRDSHYSGVAESSTGFLAELDQVWSLSELGNRYYLSLTDAGVNFAERVLFLRRNNYQRIVFESRHMAATSMFEKAIYAHWSSANSPLYLDLRKAVETPLLSDQAARDSFNTLWNLLGQVDYQFLKNIEKDDRIAQYLVRHLRRGQLYDSVRRYKLEDLHVAAKRWILGLKSESEAFSARRYMEIYLGRQVGIDSRHVAANLPKYKQPQPLLLGVTSGKSFTYESELGRFLADDYPRQYAIEVFMDPTIGSAERDKIGAVLDELFLRGFIHRLADYMLELGV